MAEIKLTKAQTQEIERALSSGYDVEIRPLKRGITIASVAKKLVYRDEAFNERELRRQTK